jgi:hypothetical protein
MSGSRTGSGEDQQEVSAKKSSRKSLREKVLATPHSLFETRHGMGGTGCKKMRDVPGTRVSLSG